MNKAYNVIHQLNTEVVELQKKLDLYLKNHDINSTDVKSVVDILNNTIRKLDHAVETLTEFVK